MATITLLSYNLWFHKAFSELSALVDSHDVDVLCLQECEVAGIAPKIGDLKLARADLLNKEIGLALFVNETRWTVVEATCHSLPRTSYERIPGKPDPVRLQLCRLTNRMKNGGQIVVGNIHVANLLASRRNRRSQALFAARISRTFAKDSPLVLAGDFNYPFGQPGLRKAMADEGLALAAKKLAPTYRHWPQRTFDYIFTTGTYTTASDVLPFGASDHAPILGVFRL